jgi:peroxiredoxin
MTDITPLIPRRPVPALEVDIVDGGRWRLADEHPQSFSMIVVYRGLHCPICTRYLRELQGLLPEFAKRGVDVIAISSDDRERAESAKTGWGLNELKLGYGLDLRTARRWGLYISTSRGKTSAGLEEPAFFAEPGLFIVKPDHTLYFASVQTMPFARPPFDQVLSAIDFVLAKDYPARGEVENIGLDQAAE